MSNGALHANPRHLKAPRIYVIALPPGGITYICILYTENPQKIPVWGKSTNQYSSVKDRQSQLGFSYLNLGLFRTLPCSLPSQREGNSLCDMYILHPIAFFSPSLREDNFLCPSLSV